jgi:hypothetical protein
MVSRGTRLKVCPVGPLSVELKEWLLVGMSRFTRVFGELALAEVFHTKLQAAHGREAVAISDRCDYTTDCAPLSDNINWSILILARLQRCPDPPAGAGAETAIRFSPE